MSGRNAISVAESEALEPLSDLAPRSAIVYAWKPSAPYLSSALRRAFSFRYAFAKRAIDIVLSGLLLIAFSPVGLAVALLVALSSRGPIFYREERVGRFRVPFRIIKFRTMYISRPAAKVFEISAVHCNNHSAERFEKRVRDPRITPIGRLLRRTSLDELPQLWNVFVGEMSLVGPRPIVKAERSFYGQYLPFYDLFYPGITGLWQVSGRSDVNYERRVLFDREYASQWSCFLDFAILARTVPAVVTMRGAY
jgi:exopolysaccharide production protein ExoY